MSVVDTNVLVHSSAITSPAHAIARAALARLPTDGPVAISHRIMREFLAATNGADFRRFASLIEVVSP